MQLFGGRFSRGRTAVAEALSAVARFEFEDPLVSSVHEQVRFLARRQGAPIGSGGARPAAVRRSDGANCAACHLDRPSADGLPPLFTDHQYEALGVPRNPAIPANHDPRYFDLGLCGPQRTDLRDQTRYCGMFATPTLRNVATRSVFFHNGVYHTLADALDFYVRRDRDPALRRFDDLPAADRANVDTVDAPFGRLPGAAPVLTPAQERDVLAFLGTLTDGYRPNAVPPGGSP